VTQLAASVSTARQEPLIVLIVEDDDDTREMYRWYLSRCGLVVEEARSGPEAIAKTRIVRPDVVVADITLPGVDGFEVCRAVRRDPATAPIPFIALTGYSRPDGPEKARRAGFDVFLLKPTPLSRVLVEIFRLARRSACI